MEQLIINNNYNVNWLFQLIHIIILYVFVHAVFVWSITNKLMCLNTHADNTISYYINIANNNKLYLKYEVSTKNISKYTHFSLSPYITLHSSN